MHIKRQRDVEDNLLISTAKPAIQIGIDKSFTYVGSQNFVLYDVAHVEQFLFVTADDRPNIERQLLIQFEGYLPDNNHTYNYPPTESIPISNADYLYYGATLVDRQAAIRTKPDSDGAQVVRFLLEKGYHMPQYMLLERFVQLDAAKRNEILLIYGEAVNEVEPETAADLAEHLYMPLPDEEQWGVIRRGVHERGLTSFTVMPSTDEMWRS